jgi:hypothetical protein
MTPVASRTLLASILFAASGATAMAQPSETPPAPPAPAPAPAPVAAPAPAPQNADWSAVSNINGQLVPVGEKNSYLYEFKRTNISADPIGWIMGFYGVSGSYAIDDHVAIRGELDYISPPTDPGESSTQVVEGDIGVPIYLRRTYQGAFIEPGLVVRQTTTNYGGSQIEAGTGTVPSGDSSSITEYGPQVLFGWHWTWESGLNVSAAVGVGRNLAYAAGTDNDSRYIPNGYFRVGYAF